MTVAATIAKQLGPSTLALLGAKDLLAYGENDIVGYRGALRFRVGRNPERVTHIIIALTYADTYDVTFQRTKRGSLLPTTVSEFEDCYVDMLHGVIEDGTGLLARF